MIRLTEYADERLENGKNDWQDFFYCASEAIYFCIPYVIGRYPIIGNITSILEVACAFGDRARWLKRMTGAEVTGMDSKEHIQIKEDGIKYFIGDALNMKDVADNTFDVVVGNGAISGGCEASGLLSECLRVSKCGVIFGDQNYTNTFADIISKAGVVIGMSHAHSGSWGLMAVRK